MSLELIFKDIKDQYVLENFRRIVDFFDDQALLNGNFKLFKIEIPSFSIGFQFKHNLKFIPNDLIILSVMGNKKVNFRHDLFTRTHLVIDCEGACCITLLAGSYGNRCQGAGLDMLPPYTPVIGVGVESQAVTYLLNSDVNYIEFFNSATQVVANRVARVDITYSGDDPTVETWKFYDQDGTSIVRTVVITHTFVANDLTNSVQVPA